MSKELTVIALGIWVIITPYLGIPSSWRTVVLVLLGLGIVIIGFSLRAHALGRSSLQDGMKKHYGGYPFVENNASSVESYSEHERKEGFTSLN